MSSETKKKSACFRMGSCCNPYPSNYRTAFAFSSLLYLQPYDRSLRFDFPSIGQGLRAYRVPRDEHANDVGSVYPPAGVVDRVLPYIRESTCLLTFWYKPVSSFGLFDMTMFIDSSPGLTISFLPLPLSACYWQTQRSSRVRIQFPAGTFPAASHRRITPPACAGGHS